jgi:hypothetical protein
MQVYSNNLKTINLQKRARCEDFEGHDELFDSLMKEWKKTL